MIKIIRLLTFSLLITMPHLSNAEIKEITDVGALEVAHNTDEVQTFLKYYGSCYGCNPSYSDEKANLIGCVEYNTESNANQDAWNVEYWLSDACSFRYGESGESAKIIITVNKSTGDISKINPKIDYIENPMYCENDSDCLCRSGSGVTFIGCINTVHGPMSVAGTYQSDRCKCINNACSENSE